MRSLSRPFVRRLCLALVVLYPLLAEPRMLWALQQACGFASAASCGMASCPSKRGGVCCCLLKRKMESKYPGLRAAIEALDRAERAADQGPCRVRAERCDGGTDQEAPAAGSLHLVPQAPVVVPAFIDADAHVPRPDARLESEPRKILKVPLYR